MNDAVNWQTLGVISGFIALWSGLFLFALKWLLDRNQQHIDKRFETIDVGIREWSNRTAGLERDFLRFQGEIAREHVRREDWIRFGTQIRQRQDAIWRELDERKKEDPRGSEATED